MFPLLAQSSGGIDGFLGTRGSIMLDVVVVAMLAVLPLLAVSVYLVKFRRQYEGHRKLQMLLGVLLLVAVLAFEVDMRFLTDWQERAEPSPYFERGTWNLVWISLIVHLVCAVPTLVLWVAVIAQALRRFPRPAAPGPHSRAHRLWGRLAGIGMGLTAVTGWIFYYLGFVA